MANRSDQLVPLVVLVLFPLLLTALLTLLTLVWISNLLLTPARFHNPNGKDSDIEKGFPADVMKALTDMGHTFKVRNANDLFFGGVQGILYGKDGKLHGGADPRRDGQALGY
jgi:gamma-glutamyltranspeptidase/glutathione hydrolase